MDHPLTMEAVDLITGKDKTELQHNRVLELALIRLVEIVGEGGSFVLSSLVIAERSSIFHRSFGRRAPR